MKILLVNTFSTGGAAKACIRLHLGLLDRGIDSNLLLLVNSKENGIPKHEVFSQPSNFNTFFKRAIYKSKKILKKYNLYFGLDNPSYLKGKISEDYFSTPFSPFLINEHELFKSSDIINLHWVAEFIDYKNFFKKSNKKIIWTLHDMFAFTGGCHVSFGCNGFKEDCKNCPQLIGTLDNNYASYLLEKKRRALKNISDLTIVCPSRWLATESSSSKIFKKFKHHVIPNGIDGRIFKPSSKLLSRKNLNIPLDKKIVLFISDYLFRNGKGFFHLFKALEKLDDKNILIFAVGSTQVKLYWENLITFGTIKTEQEMAMAYSAADVYVIPSFAENLPNTAIESLLCGTPVIGFPVGGIVDIIQEGFNGFICKDTSVYSLAFKLNEFFKDNICFDKEAIREDAIKRFDIDVCTNNYINLYEKILDR